MKRYILILLAGVILASSACSNQIKKDKETPESTAEAILADSNGFRGIKWLTHLEDLQGLEPADLVNPIQIYRRVPETIVIDGKNLPPIQYGFYSHRFCAAAIHYSLPETGRRILQILEKAYGPATQTGPAEVGGTLYRWERPFIEVTLVTEGQNLLQYRYKPVFNSLENQPTDNQRSPNASGGK